MNEFDAYRSDPTQDSLRALLRAQGDAVYNIFFQILREKAQAEDASQQVLLDLVKQIARISDASHLRAWVSRAAFHAALDLKKQARRRAAHERRSAEMQKTPALTAEQVEAVHTEIGRLDDDLRRVVVEHYFEKRPLKDLAVEQAVSEVAIWKRLQKAKERLRMSLASTGFAAALLGLDSLLEALEPVRAPEGLVGPGLVTQAAAGASSSLVLAGGIAVKTKLITGLIALLLIVGLWTLVVRQRERSTDVGARPHEVNYHYSVGTSAAPPPSPAHDGGRREATPEEAVEEFTSFMAYFQALMKASMTVNPGERTRAFRRLGYRITEEEMAAATQGCPFRPGTEEFSRHLLSALQKMNRGWDPAKSLAAYRRFTDLDVANKKRMIRQLFEDWGQRDLQGARTAASGLSEAEGRTEILTRLADPDPSAQGFGKLAAMPEGPDRTRAVDAAVAALVRDDPQAALRAVEALAGALRTEARQALAREWAGRDFDAAIAWIERTTDPVTRGMLLMDAVSHAAETNPRAAGEALLRLQEFKTGAGITALSSVIGAWARTDPAAAAKFLDRVPPFPGRRVAAGQELATRWGALDPVEALVWAQQQAAEERMELVGYVLSGWIKSPKGNPAEVRAMVRHLPEAMRPRALEAVVVAWSEFEPPAAAAFALAESPEVLARVVSQWLKRDDTAAFGWVKALADAGARDRALYGIVQGYLQVHPAKALEAAEAIGDAKTRHKVLGELASSVAKTSGIDAGVEIVRKIGDAEARDRALERMIQRASRQDPGKAAALVDMVADSARRTEAIVSILTWGAEADPQVCRSLLAKLPRVDAVHYQRVAGGFAKKDPVAAAAWALTLPERQMDPQIGDPSKQYEARPREAALNAVVNAWAASDPEGATRWVQQASLSQELRSSMLQVVKLQRDFRKR